MSLADDVRKYYEERAPVYDETAGYIDPVAEELRTPIKKRYQNLLRSHDVLEIACGTGYWTQSIAEVATSVLGVDLVPSLIAQAEDRCRFFPNVEFRIADAYTLEGIPHGFTAAFSHWWWSHIPRERLPAFLRVLHDKLKPGALVLFVDQLTYDSADRSKDSNGNTLEKRFLPDGRSFEIVKNFPTTKEISEVLSGIADNIKYTERPSEKTWTLTYRVSADQSV